MNSQIATSKETTKSTKTDPLSSTGLPPQNQTLELAELPETTDNQMPNDSPPGYQRVDEMTLETNGNRQPSGPVRLLNTGPSPNGPAPARPANYVVRPDALGDGPDFVDCPWCCTRQKTRVQEQASSMTTCVFYLPQFFGPRFYGVLICSKHRAVADILGFTAS